jgi:hypothetical protein
VPTSQCVQLPFPTDVLNVPTLQGTHSPAFNVKPAGQVHDVCPEAHSQQLDALYVKEVDPAGQLVQVPALLNSPRRQAMDQRSFRGPSLRGPVYWIIE